MKEWRVAMKTLVTGATGLLGGNLARLMVAQGRGEVRVLVRKRSNPAALEGLPVEVVFGELRDRESLAKAVRGCDYVIHCAASVSQWRPNLKMMKEVNVGGTVNLLTEALAQGVQRAVHVSTVDTLGLSSKDRPADEDWPHESLAQFRNPYIDTKYEAEQKARELAAQGLDLVIVKPTYMIGEWDVKPTSGQMIIQAAKGLVLGYPGGGNNFVDVLDVCHGILLALDQGKSGESYILANRDGNLSYREMFTLIAKVTGRRAPFFKIPYALAVGAGYVFDAGGVLLRREPDVNSVTARMGYADHYFTPEKAIRELGLPQSELEPAVRRAFEWFKARGKL